MREKTFDSAAEPIAKSAAERPETVKQPHPTDPRRWADGTQRPGVDSLARKHPKFATNTAAVQEWLREKRAAIIADRGGPQALSTALESAAGELAFVLFVLDQWQAHFIQKGLTTKGGRVRSAYQSYLSTLDRYIRLAQMIGLERRARRTQTPVEWLESLDGKGPEAPDDENAPAADAQTGQTSDRQAETKERAGD